MWKGPIQQKFSMSRMSSPQSSFSSPCRRSPRILSTAGSPMSSTASSLPTHRPNLSRRWSLDNLSTQREGYVRDLRRQHQRDRVEVKKFVIKFPSENDSIWIIRQSSFLLELFFSLKCCIGRCLSIWGFLGHFRSWKVLVFHFSLWWNIDFCPRPSQLLKYKWPMWITQLSICYC